MKTSHLFRTLFAAVLLTWSAMAAAEKALPKRVFIAAVEIPKKPDVVGRGGIAAALLAGPLGAFAADAGNNDIESAYVQFLAKNKIDVGADIAFELVDQLSAKGFEVVGAADQAEATFKVVVQNYGFAPAPGASGSIPILTIVLVASDRDGKRLWTKQVIWAIVKEIKTIQGYPVPDYLNDPKLLVNQMRKVNQLIVSNALSKL